MSQETIQDYFDSDSDINYTPFPSDNDEEEEEKKNKEFIQPEDVNATLSQEDFDTQQQEEEEEKQPQPIPMEEEAEQQQLEIIIEPVAEPLPEAPRIRGLGSQQSAPSFLELGPKPSKRSITKLGHSIYERSALYQSNPCPPKEVFAQFEKLQGVKRLEDEQYRIYYRAKDCQFNLLWLEEKMKSMGLKPFDELYWVRYRGRVAQGRYKDPWPDVGTVHHFTSGEEKLVIENSLQYTRQRNTGFVILRETSK